MVLLGENIGEKSWGGYNPKPAIAPLLMNLDLTQGSGIYAKNQPDRLTVTWHELSEYGHSNSNTIQLVLYRNGCLDFSYREIKVESGYSPIQMYVYTSATVTGHHPGATGGPAPVGPRLIGIHPGTKAAEPRLIRFSGGLPYISTAAEILFEAYDIDFYRHLHSRMAVLVVILIASSLLILFVLPFLFKTSLIRPLQALYRGMERADSGDLEVYIAPQFNDEIGALTLFFNRMLQSIQKAEANFRALAENARDGILIVSEQGRIYYGNRSAEQITKLSYSELLATPLQDIIHFQGREPAGEQFWKELDERKESKHLEATVVSHRGAVDVSVELTVSKTHWHRMPAYVAMLRDITERKRSEEQDRLYQQRLIQTDKLTTLGILAGAVAHDISNPNQVILAVSRILNRAWAEVHPTHTERITEKEQFLIAGFDQEEFLRHVAGWLADIEANSVRINAIVQSLKSYMQGEPTTMSSVNLSAVVRSAVELMGYQIRRATDRFILDLKETISNIRANPQQLEQVIINLIMNSCQALPGRDRSVEVSTSDDWKRGLVLLTVRDQGCGIPEEDLSRIKEPFFTTRREAGGIGLGLYIAASIVNDHRGSLTFKSTLGRGTEVIAAFPEENAK
jgi:PAS domain S-box-containing protein